MVFASNNCDFYHQTKTPISFWYRRRLNLKSIIQLSDILPIELTYSEINPIFLSFVCVYVFISLKNKKKGNCPTLLKRVYYV